MTPTGGGRHPSDDDRERAAVGVLREAIRAAAAGDADALAACYADEAVWLADGATHHGPRACAERHLALTAGASLDSTPQQHGAKAALRLTAADGSRRAVVVEVRRERIIFAADA